MRKVKPGKVLSEELQYCLLSVFVAELSPDLEGQLLVDISQKLIHTGTAELDLNNNCWKVSSCGL